MIVIQVDDVQTVIFIFDVNVIISIDKDDLAKKFLHKHFKNYRLQHYCL